MILDLSKIRAARTTFDRTFDPAASDALDESYRILAPVRLTFDVFKTGDTFRLVGHVQTTLELPCGRCLDPFQWAVAGAFDLQYGPQALNTGEGELEIASNDLATAYYENDQIDLGQLIREQFYLSLPMKPLCREDCQGLCPVCGTNLNRGACSCQQTWDDPRLAVLKTLIKRDS